MRVMNSHNSFMDVGFARDMQKLTVTEKLPLFAAKKFVYNMSKQQDKT